MKGKNIPGDSWPCIHCWGEKCAKCKFSGVGPKIDFVRWYDNVLNTYRELRRAYQEKLDIQYKADDYYDLEWLRKVRNQN